MTTTATASLAEFQLRDLAQRLGLTHRLLAVDVETTGVEPSTDRIVQIAGYAVVPEGDDYAVTAIGPHLVNPQCPIPAEASAIHGISDAMVAQAPTFRSLVGTEGRAWFGGGEGALAILAFNGRFDARFLAAELQRAQSPSLAEWVAGAPLLDPYRIYQRQCPRTLEAAVQHYCGRAHEAAHDAMADIAATIDVFHHQFGLSPDLPQTIAALDDYCAQRDPSWLDKEGKFVWRGGEAVCMVGKFRGVPLRRVERSYLAWMAKADSNFAADTKRIAEAATRGVYPAPPAVAIGGAA